MTTAIQVAVMRNITFASPVPPLVSGMASVLDNVRQHEVKCRMIRTHVSRVSQVAMSAMAQGPKTRESSAGHKTSV